MPKKRQRRHIHIHLLIRLKQEPLRLTPLNLKPNRRWLAFTIRLTLINYDANVYNIRTLRFSIIRLDINLVDALTIPLSPFILQPDQVLHKQPLLFLMDFKSICIYVVLVVHWHKLWLIVIVINIFILIVIQCLNSLILILIWAIAVLVLIHDYCINWVHVHLLFGLVWVGYCCGVVFEGLDYQARVWEEVGLLNLLPYGLFAWLFVCLCELNLWSPLSHDSFRFHPVLPIPHLPKPRLLLLNNLSRQPVTKNLFEISVINLCVGRWRVMKPMASLVVQDAAEVDDWFLFAH